VQLFLWFGLSVIFLTSSLAERLLKMKPAITSKKFNPFNAAQMAAALAGAPAAAVQDKDAPATSTKDWQNALSSRSLPELQQKITEKRAVGRPKSAALKQATTIRFDADVLNAFKATGRGWQTRVNDAMRDWLRTHTFN
jgi:uncharacterized protein (DUF4415 family)